MAPGAPIPLTEDAALLNAAVREAGGLALRHFKTGVKSWDKKPNDPVSEADLAVDELLHARLGGARPDYGWLSEESEPEGLERARVWVVDPIDGTRAFIDERPEFTVCAALVEDGAAVAAAIFNPATDEFFEAATGAGARLNGAAIRVSGTAELPGAQLLGPRKLFAKHKEHLPAAASGGPLPDMHYVNSIAYRVALVAAGRYDAVVTLHGVNDWDIAAAGLVLTEAGGRLTTHDGRDLRFLRQGTRQPNLLATNGHLHGVLQEFLKLIGN